MERVQQTLDAEQAPQEEAISSVTDTVETTRQNPFTTTNRDGPERLTPHPPNAPPPLEDVTMEGRHRPPPSSPVDRHMRRVQETAQNLNSRFSSMLEYSDLVPGEDSKDMFNGAKAIDDQDYYHGMNDQDPKEQLKVQLQHLERQMDKYLKDEQAWEEVEEGWDSAMQFWVTEASPAVREGFATAWKQISTAWSMVYQILVQQNKASWVPRWALPPPSSSSNNLMDQLRPERWTAWARQLSWVETGNDSVGHQSPNPTPSTAAAASSSSPQVISKKPRKGKGGEKDYDAMATADPDKYVEPEWTRLAAEWTRLNSDTSESTKPSNNTPTKPPNTMVVAAAEARPVVSPDWSQLAQEWASRNRDETQARQGQPEETFSRDDDGMIENSSESSKDNQDNIHEDSWQDLAQAWKSRNSEDQQQEQRQYETPKVSLGTKAKPATADDTTQVSWQSLANDWAERNRDLHP